MSYSMRLFAVPYRVTVCVLPVLIYIAVYLSLRVAAHTLFVSNMLVSGMLRLSYCAQGVVFIGMLLCLCEFVHYLCFCIQ